MTIKDLNKLSLAAALVVSPGLSATEASVFVDPMNGEAFGNLMSSDAEQSIGCDIHTTYDANSAQFSQQMECQAEDSFGNTLSCSSNDPDLLSSMRLLRSRGWLAFSVDSDNSCQQLEVEVDSNPADIPSDIYQYPVDVDLFTQSASGLLNAAVGEAYIGCKTELVQNPQNGELTTTLVCEAADSEGFTLDCIDHDSAFAPLVQDLTDGRLSFSADDQGGCQKIAVEISSALPSTQTSGFAKLVVDDGAERLLDLDDLARLPEFVDELEDLQLLQSVLPNNLQLTLPVFSDQTAANSIAASYSPSTGMLTIIGDAQDNVMTLSRDANGNILINNGDVAITGGTPNVDNTTTISAFGLDGNDQIALNEFNGALPQAYLLGGSGNDLLIGGAGRDYLLGGSGNDTIRGAGNDDQIFGGSSNDVLLGERGSDNVEGQDGSDLLIWNNGDGSDFLEGGEGNDTVQVNGSNTDRDVILVTPNGSRVSVERSNLDAFTLDIGSSETLDVNLLAGNDSFTGSVGLAGLISLDVDGGLGFDILTGGDGDDRMHGGFDDDLLQGRDGNDVLIGNRGNDFVFGENGNDLIVVNEGDGNDLIEGGLGRDTVQVNTSSAEDEITVQPNGIDALIEQIEFNPFTLNVSSSEVIDLRTRAGNDTVTVHDLSGVADLQTLTIDNGSGDDVVNAPDLSNEIALIVRGREGNDILFGGAGNDVLIGEEGRDIIIANGGNDFVSGGEGNDILISGDGNDVVLGGDGNDVLSGGRGNDILLASDGNDVMNGGADTDFLDGGAGQDSAINGETVINVP